MQDLVFRKSSFCDNSSGSCVEVAFSRGQVFVHDSKIPDSAPLIYTRAEWDAFIAGAKNGEFDH